jgi:hypothetical protein
MDIGAKKMILWIINAVITVAICFFIPWFTMTCYDFPLLNLIAVGGSSGIGGSSLLEGDVGCVLCFVLSLCSSSLLVVLVRFEDGERSALEVKSRLTTPSSSPPHSVFPLA